MIDKFLGSTPNQIRKYFGLKEIKNQQEQKIEELENIINKAIEYIEKYNIEGIPFYSVIKDDLLNILQGSDKE